MPEFASWFGMTTSNSDDLAIMGGPLGIGNPPEEGKLHIHGPDANVNYASDANDELSGTITIADENPSLTLISDDSGSTGSTIKFSEVSSSGSGTYLNSWHIGRNANNNMLFFSYATGGNPLSSSNYKTVLTSNGNLGINRSTPQARVHIFNPAFFATYESIEDADGLCVIGDIMFFTFPPLALNEISCFSDARLKTDIRDASPVLDEQLMKFRIRKFTVKASGEEATGVIAQEVQQEFPEMVKKGNDGYLMVDSYNPWKLIKAMQELKTQNDTLKEEFDDLNSEYTVLVEQLEKLEKQFH